MNPPVLLVTGFGPFGDVERNPSATLVEAIDGRMIAGVRVVGMVLPVSWRRAPELVLARIAQLQPVAVIGFGVASLRAEVQVETRAHPRRIGVDVDGLSIEDHQGGPEEIEASLDPYRLARALGVGTSTDAGSYVCNAWLYEVALRSASPAAFVHVPPEGMRPDALEAGLARWLTPS